MLLLKTTLVYGQDISPLLEKLEIQNQILLPVTILLVIFSSLSYLRLLKLQKAQHGNLQLSNNQKIIPLNKISHNSKRVTPFIKDLDTAATEDETFLLEDSTIEGSIKQRILTYRRNELHIVPVMDIAYIYTENTITYVVRNDGKKSVSNESLDTLFSCLDKNCFYRANRQIIIAASAISKVIKMGNCKLKVETAPESEQLIFIGKNKAASFKVWLNS